MLEVVHRRQPALCRASRLRRQRGELTGIFFSNPSVEFAKLCVSDNQHSCVLLLRQLNILQCRADGIWFRGCSRPCVEAVAVKRLKFGKEKRSKFGMEIGREK